MTSTEIRQSFLDFFREKQHAIVPSSPLLPDSPNLLFTNAGMNQFVPIFLGQVQCPYVPGRASDTQKCIRAGGKHNDLDDVGLDTYHHTFFEMLGNWSFGDYFKKEAIEWAWELVVGRWGFPPDRLYATVYSPDKTKGDPSDFDREAHDIWAEKFRAAGLDPAVHIVNGNKKDNFWMMGDTGPCGPCSELHVDLTPAGDTRGSLVNQGDARCIEIWNLVFIQFNANPDGTFTPLPAQHVDTGMGFERVASIIQGTKNFTDFANAKISNYETDIFRPIFDEIEKMSGKKYTSTLPVVGRALRLPGDDDGNRSGRPTNDPAQEQIDIAFRVIADHIRTLSFAIADGIQPGNNDRNYVLRRILRRAVRYGRTLGFHEPFFYKLVDVLARTMGDVFPEIRVKQAHVKEVLKREEEAFNKTLDKGIELFVENAQLIEEVAKNVDGLKEFERVERSAELPYQGFRISRRPDGSVEKEIDGGFAFKLYDTYGFPLDLTQLMARERGLTVDVAGFETLMEQQRARARAAQKKTVIALSEIETKEPTLFIGYDQFSTPAKVLEVVAHKDKTAVILDTTTAYAEMGGQVGDTGELVRGADTWRIVNTQKSGNTWLHFLEGVDAPDAGAEVTFGVELLRRNAIQRHHTVTHLLHWALHEVVSREATQKGSFVGPDKLTFDFNSAALTSAQVRDIEKLVNERIVENAGVSWIETPYAEVKSRADVMQFFGDKYGDTVRVVQIGGRAGAFDGYSMELCGGTHTRATGEIGLFRIVSEAAIASGVRRIEAVAGLSAWEVADVEKERLKSLAAKLSAPLGEVEKKLDVLLAQQKELEKSLKAAQQREAAGRAQELLAGAETINGTPAIIANLGTADGDTLQGIADALKAQFKGVIVLGGAANAAVSLVASVSADFTARVQAGKIIQAIAPIVGGKGGGKPDNARGGGKDAAKLDEALAKAKALLGTTPPT
jgi:alanyl-tRNA synthetase